MHREFQKRWGCGCTKGCRGNCVCRKFGITVSISCKECIRIKCVNADVSENNEDDVYTTANDKVELDFETTFNKCND